jgi:hypothetical protein
LDLTESPKVNPSVRDNLAIRCASGHCGRIFQLLIDHPKMNWVDDCSKQLPDWSIFPSWFIPELTEIPVWSNIPESFKMQIISRRQMYARKRRALRTIVTSTADLVTRKICDITFGNRTDICRKSWLHNMAAKNKKTVT